MEEALGRLESQMAVLGRRIENAQRHSTSYQKMDRAAYLIARTLEEMGTASVNELARTLALDGSTVTRQVAAMEARSSVQRKPHPDDGRAWVISLTTAGRREMNAISGARRKRFAVILAAWEPADIENLVTILTRFNESLGVAAMTTDDATETDSLSSDSAAAQPRGRRSDHRQSVLPPRRTR
jgi:DNA-binding MarR family transcriptional regulator